MILKMLRTGTQRAPPAGPSLGASWPRPRERSPARGRLPLRAKPRVPPVRRPEPPHCPAPVPQTPPQHCSLNHIPVPGDFCLRQQRARKSLTGIQKAVPLPLVRERLENYSQICLKIKPYLSQTSCRTHVSSALRMEGAEAVWSQRRSRTRLARKRKALFPRCKDQVDCGMVKAQADSLCRSHSW